MKAAELFVKCLENAELQKISQLFDCSNGDPRAIKQAIRGALYTLLTWASLIG